MRVRFHSIGATAGLLLATGLARAADPTTADCLAASEASMKSSNKHQLRAERSQLLVCAAPSCPADIRKECVSRVDEANAQIPTIIFAAKDASGADLSAVKVTMDGEVLAERIEGTALSVDPGEHTFRFEAEAQQTVIKKFLVQQAQKDRHELVTFGTPGTPAIGTESKETGITAPVPENTTKRAAGWVTGGVGVAGVGLAVLFGVRSVLFNNKSTNEANTANGQALPAGDQATFASAAQSDHSSAVTNQDVAIASGAAGGVALAVGIFLLLSSGNSAKSPASTATLVVPTWERGGGGFAVARTW